MIYKKKKERKKTGSILQKGKHVQAKESQTPSPPHPYLPDTDQTRERLPIYKIRIIIITVELVIKEKELWHT